MAEREVEEKKQYNKFVYICSLNQAKKG